MGGEGLPSWVTRSARWTPSANFLFISSFSYRKARISSSFFRFISAISLCRDISNVIYSASNILSFTMLLVDTICFLPSSNSLGPMVDTNCSRTGLEPRGLLNHSSVDRYAPHSFSNELLLLSIFHSSSSWLPDSDGTYKRHSDTQVKLRHSTFSI